MTHRFLAVLLAGILALAAFDGFELRREWSENTASAAPSAVDDSGEVTAMDGTTPYPPVKKAF
jgi:hypothetical protein